MKFWESEEPKPETILSYADLLVKDTTGIDKIVERCIASDVADDFCDHIYNVYECFWTEVKRRPNQRLAFGDFDLNVFDTE